MAFVALLCALHPTEDQRTHQGKGREKTEGVPFQEVQTACTRFETQMQVFQACTPSPFIYALLRDEHQHLGLRITALGERSFSSLPSLLHELTLRPSFRLGNHNYICHTTDLSHSRWAGLSTWADFLAEPYGHTMRFSLGTPLVLRKTDDTIGGQITHFPSPRLLFPLLAQRWLLLGGPQLPTEVGSLLDDGSVVLADYHLQSERIMLNGDDQMGLGGWLSYECRIKDRHARKTLTALTRFAFFAGIGERTTAGMGTAQVSLKQ